MNVDQVIERWEADEAAVRARLREPGTASREEVAGRSGMEIFEGIFAGELPPAPIGDTLDFWPIHMAPGEAVFQGRPHRRHYNPLGTVHGGWFATLLDSAVGCAVHSTLAAGKAFTTLELKVNMVRALSETHRWPGRQAVRARDHDLSDLRPPRIFSTRKKMKYAAFGRTGLQVSQVVLGTGNFIDTADVCQFGPFEEPLGTLLQGRREDFVP